MKTEETGFQPVEPVEEDEVAQEGEENEAEEDEEEEEDTRNRRVETMELEENQTEEIKNGLYGKLLTFLESEEGQKHCYHYAESLTHDGDGSGNKQEYLSLVINSFHFMAVRHVPKSLMSRIVRETMAVARTRAPQFGGRGGFRGGFRGRGRGRGRGGRLDRHARVGRLQFVPAERRRKVMVDYMKLRREFNISCLKKEYTLEKAKEEVAKRIFAYYGMHGDEATADNEEGIEKAFNKMKSWDASHYLEKFLPEAKVTVESNMGSTASLNISVDGVTKCKTKERTLQVARHVAAVNLFRSEEVNYTFYRWVFSDQKGSYFERIAHSEQAAEDKDNMKSMKKIIHNNRLKGKNHKGFFYSQQPISWDAPTRSFEAGFEAVRSGDSVEDVAKAMLFTLEHMGLEQWHKRDGRNKDEGARKRSHETMGQIKNGTSPPKKVKNEGVPVDSEQNPISFCHEITQLYGETLAFSEDATLTEVNGMKQFSVTVTYEDSEFMGTAGNKKQAKTESARQLAHYLSAKYPAWQQKRAEKRASRSPMKARRGR